MHLHSTATQGSLSQEYPLVLHYQPQNAPFEQHRQAILTNISCQKKDQKHFCKPKTTVNVFLNEKKSFNAIEHFFSSVLPSASQSKSTLRGTTILYSKATRHITGNSNLELRKLQSNQQESLT